jgi:hypothetical protein
MPNHHTPQFDCVISLEVGEPVHSLESSSSAKSQHPMSCSFLSRDAKLIIAFLAHHFQQRLSYFWLCTSNTAHMGLA